MNLPTPYHLPVMLEPSIEGLHIQPNGTYLDLTFGGGGHSQSILSHLSAKGKLIAFDQDPDSALKANQIKDPRFTFIEENFRFLTQFLTTYQIKHVDGILADLGVSSHQFDTATRGFANRIEGPLDMRMNPHIPTTAASIIQNYREDQIATILRQYGEISNPRKLARHIIEARHNSPITTTTQLKNIAFPLAPPKRHNKYLAKVFQAFRIAVNDELKALEEMLLQTPTLLLPHGRLVILSYHSLEDKLVKNFIKTGNLEGKIEQDFYGNLLRPLQPVHRKALQASEEEILQNNRARSVRLRIAEKL